MHKTDFPAPDWPIAEFPKLKYPLDEHTKENAEQEKLSLQSVSKLYTQQCRKFLNVHNVWE